MDPSSSIESQMILSPLSLFLSSSPHSTRRICPALITHSLYNAVHATTIQQECLAFIIMQMNTSHCVDTSVAKTPIQFHGELLCFLFKEKFAVSLITISARGSQLDVKETK
ncbi:hypothetical protein EGR_10801 [Echinococcus granulosus]|uniref:Uncharacterized protein n=1 Tax=Echinococcus granulosus TaxID=6210 RepID=W6U006_ECHGR|nr:hypothetical protein EGR_10801 [Echinococcus granulosus]EUB54338.1 hypothetical protein EGR_10801 [Echinococcus granulosus]